MVIRYMGSISSSLPRLPLTARAVTRADLQYVPQPGDPDCVAARAIDAVQCEQPQSQQQRAHSACSPPSVRFKAPSAASARRPAAPYRPMFPIPLWPPPRLPPARLPGTYSIQVDQVGTSTTTLSSAGLTTVTDPTTGTSARHRRSTSPSTARAFTLTPAGNTLNDLAAAINSAGAGVQATIVNVGGDSSPDYRLAVTSTSVGDTTIQLDDGTNQPCWTPLAAGTDAEYSVDGSNIQIQSTSNTGDPRAGPDRKSPAGQLGSGIPLPFGSDYSSLSNALSNFATAYNSAVSTLGQQIGQNAGPLAGQSIIYTLQICSVAWSTITAARAPSILSPVWA